MGLLASRRLCGENGCPALVRPPRQRCPEHERAYERQRGTAAERGYDAAWTKFSRNWRQQHPLCGERADGELYAEHSVCAAESRVEAATATDHILSMANGGAKYDEDNLQSLCASCNARKRNTVDGVNAPSARGRSW